MSPLIIQAGVSLVASIGFAGQGFLAGDNAALVVASLALFLALIALYSELELNSEEA